MTILEFNATPNLTIDCKLFLLGDDTIVDTQSAVEKTNDKGRYLVTFTGLAEGVYRLNGFVGTNGGFVNEIYDVTDAPIVYPVSEDLLGDVPQAVRDGISVELSRIDENVSAIKDVIGAGELDCPTFASQTKMVSTTIVGTILNPLPDAFKSSGDRNTIR